MFNKLKSFFRKPLKPLTITDALSAIKEGKHVVCCDHGNKRYVVNRNDPVYTLVQAKTILVMDKPDKVQKYHVYTLNP